MYTCICMYTYVLIFTYDVSIYVQIFMHNIARMRCIYVHYSAFKLATHITALCILSRYSSMYILYLYTS